MPEGDSVLRVAGELTRALQGAVVLSSDFRTPATAAVDLTGATALATDTHGKHLFTRFVRDGEPLCLHSHLGMDGSWQSNPRTGTSSDHRVRVVLRTDRGLVVGRELKVLEMIGARAEADLVARLGPDLLGARFLESGLEEAWQRARARSPVDLGTLILDQEVVAGPGTVLASEALFLGGLQPGRDVASVERRSVERLWRRARSIAELSVRTGHRVTTGNQRRGQEYWVYGREGRPCRRCGTRVVRGVFGPHERSLWWCPQCQPPPSG